ncbi:toll/interleukin-1 receptor (TIR) domain-containing protein [Artemisia annua]|uniref:Toll/interleukin-1 receptor (TIR) domain-containing protein n=1 Tax=Artemisia annua TaxID=35608 RepID=A0A2U1N7F8_ARTAN|nr:toll/interleukin-1 receptor (TIR) domain-containing protein [Artemisia annua]
MEKLRLLQLNYAQFHGSYKHFPKGLRWLSMHGFPLSCIPPEIQMENMVALDMSYSILQEFLKNPTLLRSLKFLNLNSSKIVRMGNFLELPALERLILVGSERLIVVCESIGKCTNLVIVDLNGCASLGEFPSEIKDMESLKILNASDININSKSSSCAIVEGPIEVKNINLSRNPITSLPDFVKSLSRLEFLCLEGCKLLKSVSCLPSRVVFMDANKCTSLEKITFHPEFLLSCLPYNNREVQTPIHQEIFRRPKISFLSSDSLSEIEGIRKVQPLAEVDKNIICNLGWSNLELVMNQQVQVFDLVGWDMPKELPVQMLYEHGIFSTSFRGRKLPKWFVHKSNGPIITFTVPSSPNNLRGLNVGYVYTVPHNRYGDWVDSVYNRTKELKMMYEHHFRASDATDVEDGIVCVRHWIIGKNEMEEGDKVTIHVAWPERNNVKVSQCGISFEYDDGKQDEDPLAVYKLWNCKYGLYSMIPFDGSYRHSSRHFTSPPPDQFDSVTTHKFVGYIPRRSFFR